MKHVLLATSLLLVFDAAAQAQRTFADGVFTSWADPYLEVRISPEFDYLGTDTFSLKERAGVERHLWVKAPKGRVEGLIVFQFEGFLEGVEGAYRFVIPEGGRKEAGYILDADRTVLGELAFMHSTWAYDNAESARSAPEAESARTIEMVRRAGLRLDDHLMMSRYVTEVGADSRRELILFYIEPLAAQGASLGDFVDTPAAKARYEALSDALVGRGERAFSVLEARN